MTRHHRIPERHEGPTGEWGYWVGDYDEGGTYYDRWVAVCPTHREHDADGCPECAEVARGDA